MTRLAQAHKRMRCVCASVPWRQAPQMDVASRMRIKEFRRARTHLTFKYVLKPKVCVCVCVLCRHTAVHVYLSHRTLPDLSYISHPTLSCEELFKFLNPDSLHLIYFIWWGALHTARPLEGILNECETNCCISSIFSPPISSTPKSPNHFSDNRDPKMTKKIYIFKHNGWNLLQKREVDCFSVFCCPFFFFHGNYQAPSTATCSNDNRHLLIFVWKCPSAEVCVLFMSTLWRKEKFQCNKLQ